MKSWYHSEYEGYAFAYFYSIEEFLNFVNSNNLKGVEE